MVVPSYAAEISEPGAGYDSTARRLVTGASIRSAVIMVEPQENQNSQRVLFQSARGVEISRQGILEKVWAPYVDRK